MGAAFFRFFWFLGPFTFNPPFKAGVPKETLNVFSPGRGFSFTEIDAKIDN
jgi:hypothetical protein